MRFFLCPESLSLNKFKSCTGKTMQLLNTNPILIYVIHWWYQCHTAVKNNPYLFYIDCLIYYINHRRQCQEFTPRIFSAKTFFVLLTNLLRKYLCNKLIIILLFIMNEIITKLNICTKYYSNVIFLWTFLIYGLIKLTNMIK